MKKPIIHSITDSLLQEKKITVDILRDDLNHKKIPGNKFHKLKYNIANAIKKGNKTLLTFGGAYSNHILATAEAGKEYGLKTIGIIRGEKVSPLNYTLSKAIKLGMEIHYLDRTTYKIKHTQDVIDYLRNEYGSFYLIPEGGSNYYAINGCMEIIPKNLSYDYLCCPVGTGGTIAGITLSNQNKCKIIGFPALKNGGFLKKEVEQFINIVTSDMELTQELMGSLKLETAYHFGGYAKINEELISFVQNFNNKHQIKWDLVYNGKMAFGVYDMIAHNKFPKDSRILLVHTGGLQGINGIEERYSCKIYE